MKHSTATGADSGQVIIISDETPHPSVLLPWIDIINLTLDCLEGGKKDSRMEALFELKDSNGAEFSACGKYRYALWRKWDDDLPRIMFIGLNPSTATATMDDPTIRRVKRFAMDWGYGGVYMCNLFAYISPYPQDLKKCADPIADNDIWLSFFATMCKDILFAWGNFSEATDRAKIVSEMFPAAVCLGFNKNGTPKHPLYVAANTLQVNFK